MHKLSERILRYAEEAKEHRRWLHSHPELSGNEEESAEYIANALRQMGLTPKTRVGGYGVVAVIEGNGPGKCVGLRADFDALPIQETTGLPFSSEIPGISHACGHDMHAAMLLGAARVLCDLKDQFSGRIKLIFQPAEEDPMISGAKKMISNGVLKSPDVDIVMGQHVWPQYPVGKVVVRNGVMSASSDRFFIRIRGKSSHGSEPEEGIDAIAIAAQVISALQTIVSRNVSPLDSAVITVGTVNGGNRYNIIAGDVRMEGTCRNLNPSVREKIPDQMERIIKGVVDGMGGSYEFSYFRGYSSIINDPSVVSVVCNAVNNALGKEALIISDGPSLVGEDFSYFCKEVPSVYLWLGCRGKDQPFVPLHSGSFIPDESTIPVGIHMLVSATLEYLQLYGDSATMTQNMEADGL